ncbi:MAG: sigma-70 family RNA polymerase sigma factor [Ruminococcaceae bacterium]|nr:sigma-70 family RNA polymerase sigma factor [Oscillospiraceae bacterium]
MGFNYGLEKKRFEAEWARLRKEYVEAGMSEEAVQDMYEYDMNEFRRKRIIAIHEQAFVGKYCDDAEEDDSSKSALYGKFLTELSCMDSYSLACGRFAWIETIESEALYAKLMALSDKDKELLTMIVIDELNISEIAAIQRKGISTVWEKIKRIKKYFQ